MSMIPEIDVDEAKKRLDSGDTLFVDIRDGDSYREGHVPGALLLHNDNIDDFLSSTDKQTSIIVYCYHGNSSVNGTLFLLEQGYKDVRSMTGGFENWRQFHEVEENAQA